MVSLQAVGSEPLERGCAQRLRRSWENAGAQVLPLEIPPGRAAGVPVSGMHAYLWPHFKKQHAA